MIVENGERRHLFIKGVFDGECGVSRGIVAFRPPVGVKPKAAEGALLGEEVVVLTDITPSEDGQMFTAHYRTLDLS